MSSHSKHVGVVVGTGSLVGENDGATDGWSLGGSVMPSPGRDGSPYSSE